MKLFFVLAALAMAVSVVNGYSDDDAWKDYKKKHKLDYNIAGDDGRRDGLRKKIFLAQRERINKHNSESNNYLQALSEFSVMTAWEKKQFLGIDSSRVPSAEFLKSIPVFNSQNRKLPPNLDYRDDTCMPEVKNQGGCGSCWAFAAMTPLEFSQCKANGKLVDLSEQQLVSCDSVSSGCNGGWYVSAYNYLQNSGGSANETLYPYTAQTGVCQFQTSTVETKVSTYGYIQSQNATAMQAALQQYGPIAVALNVVDSFYGYGSGVYDDKACDGVYMINHAVVIVGWGKLKGVDYWIVRNSWGPGWGANGYILIERGVNKCLIELYPAYVKAA
ncbi:zingipain-2-like isoform X1 [Daphnia pulicaria]|uniref:zingipain-2-like isoform X1 n=1 Tax=Daphnia pulicaria TaxID=35523 RepID=UPI001EEB1F5F|nr:zingipain-2-like isoform X1 [Daphnia pulicaria]XP_046647114.1 zingipain-2-like isoform X1 [Daphnia pulicaria]XP_046647115.1 zingipain-2-like isoform X1 [Daphnia pulicaria]